MAKLERFSPQGQHHTSGGSGSPPPEPFAVANKYAFFTSRPGVGQPEEPLSEVSTAVAASLLRRVKSQPFEPQDVEEENDPYYFPNAFDLAFQGMQTKFPVPKTNVELDGNATQAANVQIDREDSDDLHQTIQATLKLDDSWEGGLDSTVLGSHNPPDLPQDTMSIAMHTLCSPNEMFGTLEASLSHQNAIAHQLSQSFRSPAAISIAQSDLERRGVSSPASISETIVSPTAMPRGVQAPPRQRTGMSPPLQPARHSQASGMQGSTGVVPLRPSAPMQPSALGSSAAASLRPPPTMHPAALPMSTATGPFPASTAGPVASPTSRQQAQPAVQLPLPPLTTQSSVSAIPAPGSIRKTYDAPAIQQVPPRRLSDEPAKVAKARLRGAVEQLQHHVQQVQNTFVGTVVKVAAKTSRYRYMVGVIEELLGNGNRARVRFAGLPQAAVLLVASSSTPRFLPAIPQFSSLGR